MIQRRTGEASWQASAGGSYSERVKTTDYKFDNLILTLKKDSKKSLPFKHLRTKSVSHAYVNQKVVQAELLPESGEGSMGGGAEYGELHNLN